jgi:hypothetical protein
MAEEKFEERELEMAIKRRDLSEIRSLSDTAERQWLTSPSVSYFATMTTLCKALGGAKETKLEDYILLQDLIGRVFEKPFASGISARPEAWGAKRDLALVLTVEMPFFGRLSKEAFATIRARNAALLSLFCGQARSAIIGGFKPHPQFANVAPPKNLDDEPLIAGMDPKQIRNSESRKAYEDVIKINEENAAENGTQSLLNDIIARDIPRILGQLRMLYAHEPIDQNELSGYLKIGLFGN